MWQATVQAPTVETYSSSCAYVTLCVPFSQCLTPLFPALSIVPVALQPEATQAWSNSRRHTMQTVDKNRMDMCRPRFALFLGRTLKIENATRRSEMGRCFQCDPSTWLWHYLLRRRLLCLCIYWVCACVCVCVCFWPVECVLRETQRTHSSTVTTAHLWRALCLPSLPLCLTL